MTLADLKDLEHAHFTGWIETSLALYPERPLREVVDGFLAFLEKQIAEKNQVQSPGPQPAAPETTLHGVH